MIRELETLAKLPEKARKDVEFYCRSVNFNYGKLLHAASMPPNKRDIYDMAKVNGLIVHLARRGHYLKDIHTAAGVEKDYALRVIDHARGDDFRIRTTNYERLATCRR